MSCVIDLQKWRSKSETLPHPAGVSVPLEGAEHADLLIPQIREAIATGAHCSDAIRRLPDLVRPRERVLVLGSGLGVLSSLTAKCRGVEHVITIEPNVELADYIGEVHKLNDVAWVEIVNAVPRPGRSGRIPLFVRHDVRTSSLNPEDGPWKKVMLIPAVDLDLVLAEEQITLIVADCTRHIAPLLACSHFNSLDTILVGSEDGLSIEETGALAAHLASHEFAMQRDGAAVTFMRAALHREPELEAAVSC